MAKETVFVLGSNSFTGSHFVNACLKGGSTQVIGISRSPEYGSSFLPYKKNSNLKRFHFYQLDINNNLDEILDLCDKHRPATIANFSAQGEVRTSWNFPEQWFQTNCMSVVRLTNELRKRDYINRYVTSSTPEVYGSTAQNISENHNYYPSTPYAASKLAGDLHLITLFKNYNFPVIFTRSANVYGIHQQLFRIIPRTIIYLKLGKTIELHGNGNSFRNFIHIEDVVNATMLCIKKGKLGEIYHISAKEAPISIRSLVEYICEKMNYDFDDNVRLIDENFGQDGMYSLNSEKIRNSLGWDNKISLNKGINETINWIEKDWEKIRNSPLEYVHKT